MFCIFFVLCTFMWSAVMYCIDKCRQVQPYSLVVNAVDRGAISGVVARWVHTIQRHVWQGTPLPLCMSTNNGQWYRRSGNMVRAPRLWWLWYSNGQCTGTSPLDAHTHQGLLQMTLSPPLLTNQQNLMSNPSRSLQMWA